MFKRIEKDPHRMAPRAQVPSGRRLPYSSNAVLLGGSHPPCYNSPPSGANPQPSASQHRLTPLSLFQRSELSGRHGRRTIRQNFNLSKCPYMGMSPSDVTQAYGG